MVRYRQAKPSDFAQIKQIQKEYYDSVVPPERIIQAWFQSLLDNFIVAEADERVVGFIFFEYIDKVRSIPYVHDPLHMPNGKYAYVSEIGVLDKFADSEILQRLYERMALRAMTDDCRMVVWLTGSRRKHDLLETKVVKTCGFKQKPKPEHWESYPGHYVDDHYIWTKEL